MSEEGASTAVILMMLLLALMTAFGMVASTAACYAFVRRVTHMSGRRSSCPVLLVAGTATERLAACWRMSAVPLACMRVASPRFAADRIRLARPPSRRPPTLPRPRSRRPPRLANPPPAASTAPSADTCSPVHATGPPLQRWTRWCRIRSCPCPACRARCSRHPWLRCVVAAASRLAREPTTPSLGRRLLRRVIRATHKARRSHRGCRGR